MESFDWLAFLQQWNRDVLSFDLTKQELSPDVIELGWLGYPAATAAQVAQVEDRLGVVLPPSYRTFLATSNGWRLAPAWIERMWSAEEIEWFAVLNQEWVDVWVENDPDSQEPPSGDYFIYGRGQSPDFPSGYLQTALQISPSWPDEESVYLLNPRVVSAEGEWEAWYLSNPMPGVDRYRSFWEMMHSIYASNLAYLQRERRDV